MENSVFLDVETPDGQGVLDHIYITDLGLVMAKIFYPQKGVFINYQVSKLKSLINVKFEIENLVRGKRRRILETSL